MAERGDILKCGGCGLMAEVLAPAEGKPECCGKEMERLEAKARDEGKEKHVPVVQRTDEGIWVRVGSTLHPMEEKHYIQWIEINADGETHRKFLKPGDTPEAVFRVEAKEVTAREHCNVHGLWKG